MRKNATDWTGYQYSYTTLLYRLDHGCPSDRLLDAPDTTRQFTTL